MNKFNFIFKGNIYFGTKSRNCLGDILKGNSYQSACIIIDHALLSVPIFNDYLATLQCDVKIIECDISEPTYEKLEEKRVELKNAEIDVFIGIGGGSALDMAKGLAVLYSNDGPAISFRGFEQYSESIVPIIAIPTTAGTGSEITPNASFIDTNEKRKMGINGEAIRPKYAILDPELTLSCPKAPTISTGVDSMVHATEAFVAKKSNSIAKMFAKEGFKEVFEKLPLLIDDLGNIKLREKVMYGAFLSAIALMNSGTGPAAAMSYPLSVHFGVPHGIGGGIFLPHVIQHNIEAGCYDYSGLYEISDRGQSKQKLAKAFIEGVWETWIKLNIPQDLAEFGMNRNHVTKFVADTMDLKGALDQNPVSFYENEIRNTLESLLSSQYE
jgi:alcohol dehydrogenase class IV